MDVRITTTAGTRMADSGPAWHLVTIVSLLLCALPTVCSAAEIQTPPYNTSGFLGGEASFLCSLSGHQPSVQTFNWGKAFPLPYKPISSNNDSLNSAKYRITERYRLTVLNLLISDEGTYMCQMNNRKFEASLIVLVRPSAVRLLWTGERDWVEKGRQSRLTCSVTDSRPSASFRWFRGGQVVTSQAVSPQPFYNTSTGFSSSHSYLELTPTGSDLGMIYTCTVDLPGSPAISSLQLPVKFSGGQRPLPGYLGVALVAIVAGALAVTS